VAAGPGDRRTADAAACGYLRASHADRERVIDVLKAAFAQGRLPAPRAHGGELSRLPEVTRDNYPLPLITRPLSMTFSGLWMIINSAPFGLDLDLGLLRRDDLCYR